MAYGGSMKVYELTCSSKDKDVVLVGLTLKESDIMYDALKLYTETNKRKTNAKKLFKFWHNEVPVTC